MTLIFSARERQEKEQQEFAASALDYALETARALGVHVKRPRLSLYNPIHKEFTIPVIDSWRSSVQFLPVGNTGEIDIPRQSLRSGQLQTRILFRLGDVYNYQESMRRNEPWGERSQDYNDVLNGADEHLRLDGLEHIARREHSSSLLLSAKMSRLQYHLWPIDRMSQCGPGYLFVSGLRKKVNLQDILSRPEEFTNDYSKFLATMGDYARFRTTRGF
jgi:hypothetical protein